MEDLGVLHISLSVDALIISHKNCRVYEMHENSTLNIFGVIDSILIQQYFNEILVNINAQVAEKDRDKRLLEIYHKIDAKSSAVYKEQKFKKSDIFVRSRKLKFEGSAMLPQQKGKAMMVQVVVLSDLVFFLLENNQKYYFFSPDSKQAGVIPLDKLIVREKAGEGSRAIYLIYSKNAAELFELECLHPNDKKIWLESIREAIDQCPDGDDMGDITGENGKLQEAYSERIKEIISKIE
ncbi:hypothetical protein SK128_002777 [Halocaridina rubra]|uniref:PH domain-containing protein n=1 Tax=Halocaridina rubra TaxID=373956 RepID=A0AAN8XH12_HALRR